MTHVERMGTMEKKALTAAKTYLSSSPVRWKLKNVAKK
jgi:hypothetical protein